MRHGCDISNYTTLDQLRADYLRTTFDFVCIGLQNAAKARAFKALIAGDGAGIVPEFQYYVDLPGRDLSIASPNEWVWIDIERGAFEDAQAVRDQGSACTAAGLQTAIYCNKTSIQPVFGDSSELADWPCPLIYAGYRPPDFGTFQPFNGWASPAAWQYSSQGMRYNKGDGYTSVNCDLLLAPEIGEQWP